MDVLPRVFVVPLIAIVSSLFAAQAVAGKHGPSPPEALANTGAYEKALLSTVPVRIYRTPNGLYVLSPAGGAEFAFTAYPPGTSGAMPGTIGSDGSLVMPKGKRGLVDPLFSLKPAIYNSFAGAVAPTGTRLIHEIVAPVGTSGGYRTLGAATTWPNAQAVVDANPGTGAFVTESGEVWVGPAEAEKLWVVNDAPDDAVNDPVLGLTGKYISFFSLNTVNWSASQRTDIVVAGRSRSIEFDDSRNTAYMPGYSRTLQIKSLGPTVSSIGMVPDSRLTALVYERTGEVFHPSTMSYGNRVFVYNPTANVVWDFIPATGTVPELNTNVDSHVQAAIYGDAFFRVISLNPNRVFGEFPQTRVEVYDIPTRTQRAVYTINKQLANGGNIFGARPQISFDPRSNSLWFATNYDGSLGWLDLDSGVFTNVTIPQETGIAVGATDVEVDSAQNKLYVSLARFQAVWLGAGTPWVNGSLAEIDLATKQITRQAPVQVYPWSVAVLPTATGTFVSVTNDARQTDGDGNFGTVSIIEVASFTEVSRMRTLKFPSPTVVDLKD